MVQDALRRMAAAAAGGGGAGNESAAGGCGDGWAVTDVVPEACGGPAPTPRQVAHRAGRVTGRLS